MKKIILLNFVLFLFLKASSAQYSQNYAGNFNGVNSYVAVPSSSGLGPTSAITLEAWVYPTQLLGNTMGVIGKNYQTGYFIGVQTSGRVVFYPKGGTSLRSRVSTVIPVNQWTHIAGIYSGTTTTIYINGIFDTSTTAIAGAIGTNTDSLFIGADRVGSPSLFFKGRIDNARIWAVARNGTQIFQNRFSPLEIYAPSGDYTGLRGSFQLDNNGLNYGGSSLEIGYPRNMSFINYTNEAVNYLDYNNNLVVNGTTDYFTVNNYSGFNATSTITLEAWVKRDTTGAQPSVQNILNKSGGSSRYDYALYINSSGQILFEINSGSNSVSTSPLITNAQWTHVAATYNVSTGFAIIYMNGVYQTSTNFTTHPVIQNNPDNLYIGGIGATSFAANKFKGQIDAVRIWKIERSGNEILDNMYKVLSDGNLTDYNFDKNTNATHNGVSTAFAGNAFVGSAHISSSQTNPVLQLSSPVLNDNFESLDNFTIDYKRFFVPDNNLNGIKDSVFISSNGLITNLKVFVLMSHTYVGDIMMNLISPSGTSKILINLSGGSGNDIMTIFSDDADSLPSGGTNVNGPGITAPFSPSVRSLQSLSNFNGQNQQGWWKLKCVDNSGVDIGYVNGWGIKTSSIPLPKTLKLTALIQGFYDNSLNKMVKDTATVYLKDVNSPYDNYDSATAVLDSTGKGSFAFQNISNGVPFYIVKNHRNSIETWSSAGYSFNSDTLNYNFTLAASQAFGSNQIQVDNSPVVFANYNGDVNQDKIVDAKDIILVYNDVNQLIFAYISTDITGDDFVDASDLIGTYNNAHNVVSVVQP